MRLTHIKITNIGFLEDFDSEIFPVTIVFGGNRKGKSTITDAIMYAVGRRLGAEGNTRGIEHDPQMLRGGCDRGEIILTFDDSEFNLKVLRCVVLPDETSRYTKAADSTKYVPAGTVLNDFFKALGYNPFAMKAMTPKERVDYLLKTIPPAVSSEEIKEAVGGVVPCMPYPGIETITTLYEDIFGIRTGVNRDVDTLRKQSLLLEASPGVDDTEDWGLVLSDLRQNKAGLEASENEELLRIQNELGVAKRAAEETRRLADIEIDRDYDGRILILNRERASAKNTTLQTLEAARDEAMRRARTDGAEIGQANQEIRVTLVTKIADAEARARVQQEAEGIRKAAEKTAKDAEQAALRSGALSGALDRLQRLKSEVARRMDLDGAIIAPPKPGQAVDICRSEATALIPFSAWNTRDQEAMCLRIAIRAQGKCALVVIDSIGNWDEDAREELRETCRWFAVNKGISFIVGQATKGPLEVGAW